VTWNGNKQWLNRAFKDEELIVVLQAAARTLRLQLIVAYAGTDSDLEKAFETFSQQHGGVVVATSAARQLRPPALQNKWNALLRDCRRSL
jgi:hypothetical protein